jgi:hypothetical protein
LKKVVISNTVTSIHEKAFYCCSNLSELIFEENSQLKWIEDAAFLLCEKLEKVQIPSSVTSIGEEVFAECISLKEVVFEENSQLKSIDCAAFAYCSIESIDLPKGLTDLEECVFYDCKKLKSIIIPISVKNVSEEVFSGCSNLTIYCEAEEKPKGWSYDWNSSNCPVVWGYKK